MQFTFEAIGTHWVIDIYQSPSTVSDDQILGSIMKRITEFDQTYSRFLPNSLISQASQQAGSYTFPDDIEPLLSTYQTLYELSEGKFTPLIGDLISAAGYDAQYSLKTKDLIAPPKWHDVLSYDHKNHVLTLRRPAILDFGAGGKGNLVDLVGTVLKKHQITDFCIDAGGDILYETHNVTQPPLRVGLEHPHYLDQVIGVAQLKNMSLCASAGNRRKWGEFHHIIDPDTLTSPIHIQATWVIAQSGLIADALATCLFFVPASKLATAFEFEYAIIDDQLRLENSSTFPAEFFVK